MRGCYRCGKKGHRRTNCTDEMCSRCSERGHTADVCRTSKEEAVLAMASTVGARVDVNEDDTVQASALKAEETGEYGCGFGRNGGWGVGMAGRRRGLVLR